MGRPRNCRPKRRYSTTIDAELAGRWEAFAGRRANGAAAQLLEQAMEQAMADPEGTRMPREGDTQDEAPAAGHITTPDWRALERRLADAESQLAELTLAQVRVQRNVARLTGRGSAEAGPGTPADTPSRPPGARWEWPLDALLADEDWWATWLPRLYELLGQAAHHTYATEEMAKDGRGYLDLMGHLFPPIDGETWRSPGYRAAALAAVPAGGHGLSGARRGDVWEPVIRHVAEALCALQSTGAEGTEPYLRLRAKAEITGPWSDTLLRLVGDAPIRTPGRLA